MPVPPVPPPLDQVGARPFSFYPAIIGIERNEWAFRKTTWSEVLVFNPHANLELWIPRRFVGEVSRIDEPVVIVGLVKELEYRGGTVLPHERRVIEMPRAVNESPRPAGVEPRPEPRQAPVSGIKLESGAESRIGKMMLIAIAAGILACIAVVLILRDGGNRIAYTTVVQNDLGFTASDDYWSIVNRLGKPSEDRWRSANGELQYRLLAYPRQNLSIILMGSDRKDTHYIGALDAGWHVVHSINSDTEMMLRKLKRF
jgi:hypothetical protein